MTSSQRLIPLDPIEEEEDVEGAEDEEVEEDLCTEEQVYLCG